MREKQLDLLLGRRQFSLGVGAAGLATLLGGRAGQAFAAGKKDAFSGIKIGYAAITWGDDKVHQAITDIAAAGYSGIQLRRSITKDWKTPEELKAELAAAKLTFACLSGGGPLADPAKRAEEVEKFLEPVKFAKAAGALAVQATSPNRGDRPTVDKAELEAFADTLTAIGKETAKLGVPLVFHPHMNQIGEKPEDVAVIMKRADPKVVKMLMDVGHWAAAGGDPVAAIRQYGKRIAVLHIKDVTDQEPSEKSKNKYKFVELGQGKVDFKGCFDALKAVGFKGWAIVELDSVPKERNPKDAAVANKTYIEELGAKV
jgi:inosose dehydratase